MPTFCRHNRLQENCPICSKKAPVASTRSAPRRASKPAGTKPARAPRANGLKVRHMDRAVDDGYEHDLLPGVRASADAARLADELAFSAGRLQELQEAPPGLYADVAAMEDREEAARLAFLIAYLSPLEGDDPWRGIEALRAALNADPTRLPDELELGPRTAHEPRRGFAAIEGFESRAQRAGGRIALLRGSESGSPEQRFDRAFERLSFSGFGRTPRLELLISASRLGLVELDPWTLGLVGATALDPVNIAAKRILGIGDPVLLQRRASELAAGTGVPVAALDLALLNWSRPASQPRITAGSARGLDPAERTRVRAALGLAEEQAAGDAASEPASATE